MNITGARRVEVSSASDARGSLDTIYRAGWPDIGVFDQWNVVRSNAGVLRGVHVHSRYDEYYVPIEGRMFLALKDARRGSPSFGAVDTLWVDPDERLGLIVPAGVAHGVFFATNGVLVYGLSAEWTGDNEHGCRWNDPDLSIDWPTTTPILSDRDRDAGSHQAMVEVLNRELAERT